MRRGDRRGFLLLTVLWTVSVASVVAIDVALTGRSGVSAAHNRIAIERAAWTAHGCIATALAAISAELHAAASDETLRTTWQNLSLAVQLESRAADCDEIRLESVGARLDIRQASTAQLASLLRIAGDADYAESLAEMIVARRILHRTGLEGVPELAKRPELLELLDIGSGPIDLSHAPLPVLAGVTGFTETTAATIVHLRGMGRELRDLRSLLGQLPHNDAAWLTIHLADAQAMVTSEPRHWRLSAVATSGRPKIRRTEEWILGRSRRNLVPQSRMVR